MKELFEKVREKAPSITIEIGNGTGKVDNLSRKRIHLPIVLSEVVKLVIGGLIIALGIKLFIAPHQIAPGGASGLAIIITSFVKLPLGVTLLILNIPAFFLGYRQLGGKLFLARSLLATLVYNISVDLMGFFLPANGLSDEMILNAIFGGVVVGIGAGLVYQAGGTAGAGGVVNRWLQQWQGWPIKITTLYTNSFVIGLAGFVFGWEAAMYALVSFYISGAVADFVLEGPAVVRTALIISDRSADVAQGLIDELERGVTLWSVESAYTQNSHKAILCTVTRPEINALKNIVAWVDDKAFVMVLEGHEALGKGFQPIKWSPPPVEDIGEED